MFALFLAVVAGGTLYLRYFALESGLTMNLDRSIFWAINAATLSGIRISPNGLADFSSAGVLGVFVLMLAGGLFSLIVGSVLVCRYVGLRHGLAKLSTAAVLLVVAGSAIGAAALMSAGRSVSAALFEAVSAITNTGLNLDGARGIADWRLHLVIVPLAVIGSLGLPVLVELWERLVFARPISSYSARVMRVFAIAWLCGFALLLLANLHLPWRENLLASWIGAVNSRSLGVEVYLDTPLTRVSWWCMGLLMLIGAPPAGTGGGARLLPVAKIVRYSEWNNDGGQVDSALARAIAWMLLFGGLFFATFLLLMSAEGQLTTDRAMSLAAAAVGNVGLPQDQVSLSTRGLAIISASMLAGHLLPLRFMHLIVGRRDNSLL